MAGGGEVDDFTRLQREARALVERASIKVRGSVHHGKLRRHHVNVYCRAVREGLLRGTTGLRYRRERSVATKRLEAALGGIGANRGIAPDFSDAEALRGYALAHFGRALLLSELAIQTEPDWLHRRVSGLFSVSSSSSLSTAPPELGCSNSDGNHGIENVRLASLGGGCGYDFVAFAALSEYLQGPSIDATVYDNESGWKDIVADVERVVRDMFPCSRNISNTEISERNHQRSHRCGFDSCDITSPLDSISNEALASAIDSTQIYSCSYVVAENAVELQRTRFGFFQDLFSEALNGSLFFFTETTHRLWPDLLDLVRKHNRDTGYGASSIRVAIPHIRCGKNGWQLGLLKGSASETEVPSPSRAIYDGRGFVELSKQERKLYERFRRDNLSHLSRLERGWKRDERKFRGAK